MPVIPGFFKNFNELIDCSSDLTRITMNDEYKKVIIKNRLAGFPNAPAPDSIESFYDHIEEHATRVHNYLANQGRYAVNNWEELKADWFAYGTLVKNTDLFYRMIARLPPLPYYHGLDDELVKILTGTPLSPLLAAVYNLAIDDLPLLKPIDYDVKWWSRGYEGSMAFIGANTRINPDGGKFEGFYAFPDAVGNNMIKKGDIISNRGPILAHASPYKPMEFCLRQSMSHPDSDLPDYEDYWEFGFARRIIFEIDFITARNVAPWSAPDREELIFLADRRFKVVEIDEATFNYKTLALVVRLQEIPESSVPKKTPYRDLISGETYYSPIPINELELKKIIDLSNEKQNPLINKIISYVKNR